MMSPRSAAFYDHCSQAFLPAVSADGIRIALSESELTLPRYSPRTVKQICSDFTSLSASEPTLLRISSPLIVVGDLHGHFLDLLRIFKQWSLPPDTRYLFLGDMIDRGSFSL
jgi:protein phosphatase